ncbi:hypothetical protein D3C73_558350 [compost metagenome]
MHGVFAHDSGSARQNSEDDPALFVVAELGGEIPGVGFLDCAPQAIDGFQRFAVHLGVTGGLIASDDFRLAQGVDQRHGQARGLRAVGALFPVTLNGPHGPGGIADVVEFLEDFDLVRANRTPRLAPVVEQVTSSQLQQRVAVWPVTRHRPLLRIEGRPVVHGFLHLVAENIVASAEDGQEGGATGRVVGVLPLFGHRPVEPVKKGPGDDALDVGHGLLRLLTPHGRQGVGVFARGVDSAVFRRHFFLDDLEQFVVAGADGHIVVVPTHHIIAVIHRALRGVDLLHVARLRVAGRQMIKAREGMHGLQDLFPCQEAVDHAVFIAGDGVLAAPGQSLLTGPAMQEHIRGGLVIQGRGVLQFALAAIGRHHQTGFQLRHQAALGRAAGQHLDVLVGQARTQDRRLGDAGRHRCRVDNGFLEVSLETFRIGRASRLPCRKVVGVGGADLVVIGLLGLVTVGVERREPDFLTVGIGIVGQAPDRLGLLGQLELWQLLLDRFVLVVILGLLAGDAIVLCGDFFEQRMKAVVGTGDRTHGRSGGLARHHHITEMMGGGAVTVGVRRRIERVQALVPVEYLTIAQEVASHVGAVGIVGVGGFDDIGRVGIRVDDVAGHARQVGQHWRARNDMPYIEILDLFPGTGRCIHFLDAEGTANEFILDSPRGLFRGRRNDLAQLLLVDVQRVGGHGPAIVAVVWAKMNVHPTAVRVAFDQQQGAVAVGDGLEHLPATDVFIRQVDPMAGGAVHLVGHRDLLGAAAEGLEDFDQAILVRHAVDAAAERFKGKGAQAVFLEHRRAIGLHAGLLVGFPGVQRQDIASQGKLGEVQTPADAETHVQCVHGIELQRQVHIRPAQIIGEMLREVAGHRIDAGALVDTMGEIFNKTKGLRLDRTGSSHFL